MFEMPSLLQRWRLPCVFATCFATSLAADPTPEVSTYEIGRKVITVPSIESQFMIANDDLPAESGEESSAAAFSDIDQFAQLSSVLETAKKIRRQIDASQFDLSALIDRLDYDAELIADFVSTSIRYEPYEGLLRGAQGTLMARAGNSVDQALLLGTLLRDAGYEARIHRGSLSQSDSEKLVAMMTAPTPAPPVFRDAAAIQHLNSELLAIGGVNRQQAEPSEMSSAESPVPSAGEIVEAFEEVIQTALHASGIELDVDSSTPDGPPPLDYFWVTMRDGPTAQWVQLHPAFPTGSAPNVEAEETFVAELPVEFAHRIRIQAKIRRRLGSQSEIFAIMDPWERPVANLIGFPVSYGNFPNLGSEAIEESTVSFERILDDSTIFFPRLNGFSPPGAQAFDLAGNVIDPMAAGSMMAGVFQQVGEGFVDASTALSGVSGESSDSPAMFLEENWLEITLIAPDGKESAHKRILWDGSGEAGSQAVHLTSSSVFAVLGGEIPAAYTLDRLLGQIIDIETILPFYFEAQGKSYDRAKIEEPKQFMADQLVFSTLVSEFVANDPQALSFVAGPYVLGVHRHVWIDNYSHSGFDIISNPRRAFRRADSGFEPDAKLVSHAGVWESLIEQIVVPPGNTTASGFMPFPSEGRDSLPNRITVIVEPSGIPDQGLPDHQRDAMIRDLELGFVLLLPTTSSGDGSRAWWRVKPMSGETLAMNFLGWGASPIKEYDTTDDLVEYLTCVANVSGKCRNGLNWIDAIGTISWFLAQKAVKVPPGAMISWPVLLRNMKLSWMAAGGGDTGRAAAYRTCLNKLVKLVCSEYKHKAKPRVPVPRPRGS